MAVLGSPVLSILSRLTFKALFFLTRPAMAVAALLARLSYPIQVVLLLHTVLSWYSLPDCPATSILSRLIYESFLVMAVPLSSHGCLVTTVLRVLSGLVGLQYLLLQSL